MQPPCSLPLGPCGPAPSLGSQGSTDGLHQLEEKQLFEKFWRGTFKAVATPRPESVIVASITARTRVANFQTTLCQPLKADERKAADTRVEAAARNGCIKGKARKHHSHRRARSPSFDEELSPRPKAKKKKRKSERKRKRKRSPSYSLSPLRKKKKKKKKSSKKSKRHRYTSKKSKHSSSSLKHKRRDKRKHKKSSRTHSRRSRRYRRSESYSSSCHSSAEYRHHLQKSVVHQALGDLAAVRQDTDTKWRPATKSVCKMAPNYRSILSTSTILSSKPGSELLQGKGSRQISSQVDAPHDYDSGNDTSSPPSSKTDVSRSSVTDNKRSHCRRLTSPEKLRFTDRDNASDSGNSVTSYTSLCKPYREDSLSATVFSGNGKREQITLGCQVEVATPQKTSSCSRKMSLSSRKRRKTRTSSSRSRSRSRSRSSGSSRYSGRYSRSPSLSSCSSYSRSPSYSADLRRRGSVASLSSRGSYSRRLRDRKRAPSHRATDVKTARKVSGKRRRRKSYSPMKKRRRDSPSHLEARRITSARKRPIPYFRPSPSSSSRSTSVSSWSSLFTRSRSRSPIHSVSRSRSRSRSRSWSYSSYRSYSRSSSFNSIFGTRSRSRSCGSLKKRHRTRR
ncbi:serine/arginine repetitive matrix protein 4 [Hippoglossus hippoglossus]|uniref:serine/arginine repetitive matrix protein 4 n=1 Tax=Hippoglossus hippoglossus TaxID=8267 RepID=UPI00148CD1E1|nr:serine/arginine repetitive matrix protein 4 [Hippoglossus hippoglossus]